MTTPGTQYALFESVEALPVEHAVHTPQARQFSDYVVYVDESGDHSLASIDKDYPVFVLALCIFHKRHYAETIIPAVEKLKFNYFGHDSVVLHEHEISKQKGAFAFLSHNPTRDEFMMQLSSITGLQLADLVALPVGLNHIRPQQPNQAFDMLKRKFFCDGGRNKVGEKFENVGLKVYPAQKAKSPGEPTEAVAPTRNPQST